MSKETRKYRLTIKPVEPYTFGGENGFSFSEIGLMGTYYMETKKVPEQTSLIGMVRYLMLQYAGNINTSFNYSKEQQEENDRVCGPDSFSFEPKEEQSFGIIKSISPMYIVDDDLNVYIKNPFCNTGFGENGMDIFKLSQQSVECSADKELLLPINTDKSFDCKNGYGNGYICISKDVPWSKRMKNKNEIFSVHTIAGNKKDNDDNEDGFFRRETISMKSASFGLNVTLEVDEAAEELPKQQIVYMGKKKCTFIVSMDRDDNQKGLDEMAEEFFKNCNIEDTWYYCLSDVLPTKSFSYNNFGIVETKLLRNLRTSYDSHGMTRKGQKKYGLICAGSVFNGSIPEGLIDDKWNIRKCGYNHIIKMGGF